MLIIDICKIKNVLNCCLTQSKMAKQMSVQLHNSQNKYTFVIS